MFHTIPLKSASDVYDLLLFLQSPISRLPLYIADIDIIEHSLAASPWLHLLHLLYPKLQVQINVNIELTGPLHPAFKSMRSVHYQLPKYCPTFSQCIEKVVLKALSLNSFSDLIYLVGEMPALKNLSCKEVTWGLLPPGNALPLRRIAANHTVNLHTTMSKCTQNWMAVWIYLGLRYSRMDPNSPDIPVLADLASVFMAAAVERTLLLDSEFSVSTRKVSDRIHLCEYLIVITASALHLPDSVACSISVPSIHP